MNPGPFVPRMTSLITDNSLLLVLTLFCHIFRRTFRPQVIYNRSGNAGQVHGRSNQNQHTSTIDSYSRIYAKYIHTDRITKSPDLGKHRPQRTHRKHAQSKRAKGSIIAKGCKQGKDRSQFPSSIFFSKLVAGSLSSVPKSRPRAISYMVGSAMTCSVQETLAKGINNPSMAKR